jgi:hypothetical protein
VSQAEPKQSLAMVAASPLSSQMIAPYCAGAVNPIRAASAGHRKTDHQNNY